MINGKAYSTTERGYIELDAESKTLKIKRGWTNNAYSYSVEGWTGRYGMPLEFLLSVHVATQMPDLAMEIATSFDTEVTMLLSEVNNAEIKSAYNVGGGVYVTLDQILDVVKHDNNFFQDAWNAVVDWFASWNKAVEAEDWETYSISMDEFMELFNMGLPHDPDNCECGSEIPGSIAQLDLNGSTEEVTDADGNTTEEYTGDEDQICKACRKYIKSLLSALKEVQDGNFQAYTPYISEVTDHWFRDVYFVIKDPDDTEVTSVDEDYFYETEERWTLYETYEEGDDIPSTRVVGDYKLYIYENGTYTEASADVVEAVDNGDDTTTNLVKKPITEVKESNDDESGYWSAYEFEDYEGSWTVVDETDNETVAKFEGSIYYKESITQQLTQVEDGQRGVTNDTIKNMFTNNYYYQYDGTVERAEAIETEKSEGTDVADEDNPLKAQVSIAKDSLNAFSMLENTHTLDADYIYKDFKELIVELDYFDKEDLSDKVETVMQWILPDTGSGGWPLRAYEKGETFYGTLINSKVDLELLKNADVEEAEALMSTLADETDNSTTTTATTTAASNATGSISSFIQTAYDVHAMMEEDGDWDYCVYGEDSSHWRRSNHTHGLMTTIQEAKESLHNTCCATYVSWVLQEAGLWTDHTDSASTTYAWVKEQGWQAITSYDDLQPGDLLFNKAGYTGTDTSNIGHVQILGNDGEWLNAGSVDAINSAPSAYTANFIIGMRSGLSGTVAQFEGYDPETDVVAPVTGKVTEWGTVERENEETGKMETVEFIKIEAVNSYLFEDYKDGYEDCDDEEKTFEDEVTDSDRKAKEGYNYFYDEYQGVIDGFVIYIEGFDLTLFDVAGQSTDLTGEQTTVAKDENNPTEVKTITAEEDGSAAKYLNASSDDKETVASEISRYSPSNEVYNMNDNVKEAQYIWMEDAKAAASPILYINGEYYIKEGTVIGKTYNDIEDSIVEEKSTITTDDGTEEEYTSFATNGNYMRLILRNLEDAIVEDVETYMDIDDGVVRAEVDWEFYYWVPYESGGLGESGVPSEKGAGACGTISSSAEVAVGIAQWTTYKSTNNIAEICKWLAKQDSMCSSLSAFGSMSADQIIANYADLKTAWTAVNNTDTDRFLELQMQYFYEVNFQGWLEEKGTEWLLDKPLVVQGTYASLMNWGPNLGWEDVINSSMSDEEICEALLKKACGINSTCGTLEARWESQYVLACDILDGTFTDVETWVRTAQPYEKYGNGKNAGALLGSLDVIFNVVDYVLYGGVAC